MKINDFLFNSYVYNLYNIIEIIPDPRGIVSDVVLCFGVSNIKCKMMADFDQIYEEDDEDDRDTVDSFPISVPDPVVVRGAGNIKM